MDKNAISRSDSDLSSCSESVNRVVEHPSTDGQVLNESGSGPIGGSHLVLVGSCGTNKTEEKSTLQVEAKDEYATTLACLKQIAQQFTGFTEVNALREFQDKLRAVSTQMEALTGQMRDLQVLFLKNCLASPRAPFPGLEQENLVKLQPQDQVFQTPRKTQEQPLRLDVTPVSTLSDAEQQNGVSSTINANLRRSLAFHKEVDNNKESRANIARFINSKSRLPDVPTPKLSLVNIKSEPGLNNSPSRCDSKLGLLVLADAALTRTPPDQTAFFRTSDKYVDYDSGRYSGSSCGGSPPISQDINKTKPTEKHSRVYKHNTGLITVQKSKSGFSSSSSTSSDVKLRKRRKVKQPIPCNFCGKCFNNQSSLRQHESFHRPIRPFKCENEKCDKAYKTRSELNRHLVVHSGEKQHECKLCGKRFLRKQYLKTHLLRHHETGLAMVAPSAIESFKNDTVGSIPSIVVSSSLVSQTEPLTWRCQMCFKIFVNNEDLMRHIRSYHEKKKPLGEKMETSAVESSMKFELES